MSKSGDDEREKTRVRAEVAKVAEQVTLAAASIAVDPKSGLTTTALVAASGIVGLLTDKFRTTMEAKTEKWWDAFLKRAGTNPHDTLEEIQERMNVDPNVGRVIFDHARALLDADDAALATLGALAADYLRKPIDAFFRGMTGLLSDVDGEEFEAIARVVHGPLPQMPNATTFVHYFVWSHEPQLFDGPDRGDLSWGLSARFSAPMGADQGDSVDLGDCPCAYRVAHLLKRHGLGEDWGSPEQHTYPVFSFRRDVIVRMARYLPRYDAPAPKSTSASSSG